MTEREKMVAGMLYDAGDDELARLRRKAHRLCQEYNVLYEDDPAREELLRALIPDAEGDLYLQGPIYFDYGVNTHVGENFYANFNLTVLDVAPVEIGRNVQFGPNVSLMTPVHPLRWQDRNEHVWPDGRTALLEYAKPITIGSNCWLAANVTVAGGVRVGAGSVIGAGSVVTRDIPPDVFAAGVPCRVVRPITEADDIMLRRELFK
ncbi:MAG: sugar O-acetyltransferase [Fretibacterium sp.]|nr:sugar O-acetyltransferase [Fretibacterium sp.]